jgi:hypothetical protein
MALCQNVQTFCAAQVIYWTGMNGIDYVFNIFIADTSLMQNRLIWMAFTGFPYVVNTFVSPPSISYLDEDSHGGIKHRLVPSLAKHSSSTAPGVGAMALSLL